MTNEQRLRVIDKILEENDNETLWELLGLDFEEVFNKALNAKSDDELLEMIL